VFEKETNFRKGGIVADEVQKTDDAKVAASLEEVTEPLQQIIPVHQQIDIAIQHTAPASICCSV
jgi:hypothetical protein